MAALAAEVPPRRFGLVASVVIFSGGAARCLPLATIVLPWLDCLCLVRGLISLFDARGSPGGVEEIVCTLFSLKVGGRLW